MQVSPKVWMVPGHADVAGLLGDRRLGRQFRPEYLRASVGTGPAADFLERIIVDRDPPDHSLLRQVIGSALGPARVRLFSEKVQEILDSLLEPIAERGSCDLVRDLAMPFPQMVVCHLLGIPESVGAQLRPCMDDLIKVFSLRLAADDRRAANGAVLVAREHLNDFLYERRSGVVKARPEGLVFALAEALRHDAGFSREEIIDNLLFVLLAGSETTTNLLGSGVLALLQHPAELARLRREPELVPLAVEELLRYDSPLQHTSRLALQPVEVGEQRVPAGHLVVLLIGSANRDEAVFATPDRPRVDRTPNPHVAFGGGLHHCLGAVLARLEGRAAFAGLTQRFSEVEQAGEALRRPSSTFRALASLPLSLRPAA